MYYDDELYDDGRHCECGELFGDLGYCPACDGDPWIEWGPDEDEDDDELLDDGVYEGDVVVHQPYDDEADMG